MYSAVKSKTLKDKYLKTMENMVKKDKYCGIYGHFKKFIDKFITTKFLARYALSDKTVVKIPMFLIPKEKEMPNYRLLTLNNENYSFLKRDESNVRVVNGMYTARYLLFNKYISVSSFEYVSPNDDIIYPDNEEDIKKIVKKFIELDYLDGFDVKDVKWDFAKATVYGITFSL